MWEIFKRMNRETTFEIDDVLKLIEGVIDEAKKRKKVKLAHVRKKAPGYFKGLSASTANKRAAQFVKQTKMSDDNPQAYKKAPGDDKKTRTSKWTTKFHKMFESEGVSEDELDSLSEYFYADDIIEESAEEILDELLEEDLYEGLSAKTMKALKNKAKKANAPLGALTTVYKKGLAAWKTGHRPGAGQEQWGFARVNSFLAGGPARRVDAAQWKRVQKHRKKKR